LAIGSDTEADPPDLGNGRIFAFESHVPFILEDEISRGLSMPLKDRTDELKRRTSTGREWFIGYEFTDNGEQVSTVIDAFSKKDALEQFQGNFWRIAFGDLSGKGPNGVDPHDLYEIIEVRWATSRDRRAGLD
jgi:hypothetical protein